MFVLLKRLKQIIDRGFFLLLLSLQIVPIFWILLSLFPLFIIHFALWRTLWKVNNIEKPSNLLDYIFR